MIQRTGRHSVFAGVAAALAVGLLLFGAVFAAPAIPARAGSSPVPQSAGDIGVKFSVNGAIDSVDYAKNLIVVDAPSGKMTIAVTPTTAITVRGQIGGVSDLRKGGHVAVSGTQRNGVNTALSITVK
jgi:hypothetical protein